MSTSWSCWRVHRYPNSLPRPVWLRSVVKTPYREGRNDDVHTAHPAPPDAWGGCEWRCTPDAAGQGAGAGWRQAAVGRDAQCDLLEFVLSEVPRRLHSGIRTGDRREGELRDAVVPDL